MAGGANDHARGVGAAVPSRELCALGYPRAEGGWRVDLWLVTAERLRIAFFPLQVTTHLVNHLPFG